MTEYKWRRNWVIEVSVSVLVVSFAFTCVWIGLAITNGLKQVTTKPFEVNVTYEGKEISYKGGRI